MYWIHLSTAQDTGLEFWQTGSNATVTFQSVPSECVVKVVNESRKRKLFARQLSHRKRPKVTLRESWVHTSSNDLRKRRETESRLQIWDSDPIPSGSRNWPKEEFEQSVDLRVDVIPDDETYKDEHNMQRIAEQIQIQKLPKTYFFKEDSPRGNILSEKAAAKKMHEAGNCELHDVQQRTDKVQCQLCYSHVDAGFQVCPCGGKLNMSEEMLSCIRQKN